VDIGYSRDIEIEHRDGKLDQLKESTESSLNLTLYVQNRYSSHSTNDLRREALSKFISEAVAMTKYLAQDPDRRITDPKYYQGRQQLDLKLYDAAYESVAAEDRVRLARECEQAARAAGEKVLTATGYYSDSLSGSVKVHSNGFEGERHGTTFSIGVEASVQGEGGTRPSDWDERTVRFVREFPQPAVLGENAVRRALARIGQTKIASGVYDMVVENRTASRLLGPLFGPLSGSGLYRKNSYLDGRLGQKIASEKLTLIDDPFIESGLGSRLYDGEGMSTRKRVIIDKGVLRTFLIDCYYGRKLKMEPTGAGTSNLVFEYGTRSLDELVAQMTRGILVTNFVGGNSNSTTGEFSFGVAGLLVENGRVVQPVNEMNIAGNFLEFWQQLAEVGNDPYIYSSTRRPSMYFKDVQFAGL